MAPGIAFDLAGSGPRVVLVHGFTQTAMSFERLAASLQGRYEVLSVDAPGHGRSTGTEAGDLPEAAAAVAAAGGRAAYVGYSMGGRICLQLALDRPDLVRALVLVSTSAGIEDRSGREARRQADNALADRLDPPDGGAPGLTTDEFLEEWLGGPLFRHLGEEQRGLDARRANTPAGLASSLRTIGAGTMEPLWDRLGELGGRRTPVLVIAGAEDPRYVELGRRIAVAAGPRAALAIVEGSGHSVPAEQPDELARLVGDFLAAARLSEESG